MVLRSLVFPTTLIVFVINVWLVLQVHAADDESVPTLLQRLLRGPDAWETSDRLLFVALVLASFELLDYVSKHSGVWMQAPLIPVRGKHLDDLRPIDRLFIGCSKAATVPFTYLYLRFVWYEPAIVWGSTLTLGNTLGALVSLFVVYDFFYTILHWFLHIKAIYGWVHKHHHIQKAPSRANVDAVNVHPVEFFLGEYNHLWALFLITRVLPVHAATTLAFLVIGGFLAGLNHTRFDVQWGAIFDSKAHDVHHRIPQSNYGQYTMFWDRIFGTFRPYNAKDRINPDAQLDPKTGKSKAVSSTKSQ